MQSLITDLPRPRADSPFEDMYRGYLLRFKPQPTPDGRFLAYVIIRSDIGSMQTAGTATPDSASFGTQEEAARCGQAVGRAWVDRHGL